MRGRWPAFRSGSFFPLTCNRTGHNILLYRIPFLQPSSYLGSQLSLALGAHINSNVASFKAHVFGIFTSHAAGQKLTSLRWDQVVEAAVDIKNRHGDVLKIDPFASQFHFALDEQILLEAVPDELPEDFSRNVRTVKNPLFHSNEVLHEDLVVHIFKEADVFIEHQPGRVEHEKTYI